MKPIAPVIGLVGIAAVAVVAELTVPAPAAPARPTGTAVGVTTTSLVCPDLTGGPGGLTTTMTIAHAGRQPEALTWAPMTGAGLGRPTPARAAPTSAVTKDTPFHAVLISATGSNAGDVAADQTGLEPYGGGRALSSSACLAPRTDWWFAGANGRVGTTDTLLLANPGQVAANVSVSGWSHGGPTAPPHLQSLTVLPGTSQHVTLSDYVANLVDVAVHVHANSGSVVAAVFDQHVTGVNPVGADYIPPTLPPATTVVVPGYLGSSGARNLYLANPGGRDASVTVRVVTPSGSFTPAAHHALLIPGGQAAGLDLRDALGGGPGAVIVSSDVPVVAEGSSVLTVAGKFWEMQWQAAATALSGRAMLASNAAPFGQTSELLVSAPDAAGRLRLTAATGRTSTVAVAGGRTVEVDLRALFHSGPEGPGPLVLESVGRGAVYVSRTLSAEGAHGPLITATVPVALPGPIQLPPAIEDLRVALPR